MLKLCSGRSSSSSIWVYTWTNLSPIRYCGLKCLEQIRRGSFSLLFFPLLGSWHRNHRKHEARQGHARHSHLPPASLPFLLQLHVCGRGMLGKYSTTELHSTPILSVCLSVTGHWKEAAGNCKEEEIRGAVLCSHNTMYERVAHCRAGHSWP